MEADIFDAFAKKKKKARTKHYVLRNGVLVRLPYRGIAKHVESGIVQILRTQEIQVIKLKRKLIESGYKIEEVDKVEFNFGLG